MMIHIAFAAVVAAAQSGSAPPASAAPAAHELSDAELRDQVDAYLGSIDTAIASAEWSALGPRANALLEEIARNPRELPTRRAKAIDGLAALNGPDAPSLFGQVASRETEPVVVRFAAVRGLARVTPENQTKGALGPLMREAKDSRVRAVAADQLAQRTGGKSCDAVRAQAAKESGTARAHFDRALARCTSAH